MPTTKHLLPHLSAREGVFEMLSWSFETPPVHIDTETILAQKGETVLTYTVVGLSRLELETSTMSM